MARVRGRMLALPVVIALAAAACGSDREAAAPETTAAEAETTAAAAAETTAAAEEGTETTAAAAADTTVAVEPEGETFGDLTWPCGPGDGANTDDGSEKGVTAESVTIAYGDDAGFVAAPGLNKETTDSMNAMVAKCNELGGINGREIKTNYYDAKLFEVKAAIQAACDADNFFLVGQGWAGDNDQEETRVACGLPSVPTYTVSLAFANAPLMFQGVPNPADEIPGGFYFQIAEMFPEDITNVVTLGGDFSSTQLTISKYRAAAPLAGWTFGPNLKHNPGGETDWTPFVKQVQDANATAIVWSGTCLPNLQNFARTMKQNGLDLRIYTDANHYEAKCAAANTDGAMDNVYMRMGFNTPQETDVKAVADYAALIEESGGETSLLGEQAASSFLLWATAASECGAALTRECVLDNLAAVTSWTGGGLHAETNPGENHPPFCNVVWKLAGTGYERVDPATGFACDEENYILPVAGIPELDAILLDADRIARQYDAG